MTSAEPSPLPTMADVPVPESARLLQLSSSSKSSPDESVEAPTDESVQASKAHGPQSINLEPSSGRSSESKSGLQRNASTHASPASTFSKKVRTPAFGSTSTSCHLPSQPVARVLSSGDDFYDQGYCEAEQELDLPTSLQLYPVACRSMSASSTAPDQDKVLSTLHGRDDHLRALHEAYKRILFREDSRQRVRTNEGSGTQRNDAESAVAIATELCNAHPHQDAEHASESSEQRQLPVVFVYGTSGSGKSQLVQHFLAQIKAKSQTVNPAERTTKLSSSGLSPERINSSPYVVQGKYQQSNMGQNCHPFSALTQAFGQFCQLVESRDDIELTRVQHCIREAFQVVHADSPEQDSQDSDASEPNEASKLSTFEPTVSKPSSKETDPGHTRGQSGQTTQSSALAMLVNLIPQLGQMLSKTRDGNRDDGTSNDAVDFENNTNRDATAGENGGDNTVDVDVYNDKLEPAQVTPRMTQTTSGVEWNKLQYAFGRFLRAIATKEHPLLLVLDDLQWASQASIDLISSFLLNSKIQHFMLIGIVRCENMPDGKSIGYSGQSVISDVSAKGNAAAPVPASTGRTIAKSDLPHILDRQSPLYRFLSQERFSASEDATKDDEKITKLAWTEVHVANWTEQEVHSWLSFILQREEVSPYENSDTNYGSNENDKDFDNFVCYLFNKTDGNPFFLIHVLEDLQRTNRLVYSRMTFQWDWSGVLAPLNDSLVDAAHLTQLRTIGSPLDADDGGGNASASQDEIGNAAIAGVLASKLNALPVALRTSIALASYIQYTFKLSTLQTVLRYEKQYSLLAKESATEYNFAFPDDMNDIKRLSGFLEQAVLGGLLQNSIGGATYSFAHDRILQAARGLVPYGELRDKLTVRVGKYLLQLARGGDGTGRIDTTNDFFSSSIGLSNESLASKAMQQDAEQLLFVAANHLNSVPIEDQLGLAHLNLEIGERAVCMAAKGSASLYLQLASNALRKLKIDPWKEQYEMCLRLYRVRTDVELSQGNYELGYRLGGELLDHACSLHDKIPTYYSMAIAMGCQSRHKDCLELCRGVVRLLCSYPSRFPSGHVLKHMIFLRRYFRKITNEQFLSFPVMTNTEISTAMKFLTQIILRGFNCRSPQDWMLAAFIMTRFTVKHGLCEDSGFAMVVNGVVAEYFGDHASARRYGQLALAIINKIPNSEQAGGWVVHVKCHYIDAWSEPARQMVQSWSTAHEWAMTSGQIELAMLCWQACNFSAYLSGYPIGRVFEASQSLLEQQKILKVDNFKDSMAEMHAVAEYMSERRPIDWESLRQFPSSALQERSAGMDPADLVLLLACGSWARMHLALFFSRYDIAEELCEAYLKFTKDDPSYFMVSCRSFYEGLTAAGMYRETGKNKHFKTLCRCRRQLKKLCNDRGLQSLHRALLLRAERKGLMKKCSLQDAKQAYDDAIMLASNSGHIHEAGLACEMAGEFLLRSGDTRTVGGYLNRAYDYYRMWGATAKARSLQDRRSVCINREKLPQRNSNGNLSPLDQPINRGPQSAHATYDLISAHKSVGSAKGNAIIDGSYSYSGAKSSVGDDVSLLTET